MSGVNIEELTVLEAIIHFETYIKPKREVGSCTMLTKEGEITMLDFDTPLDELILYGIFFHPEFQRRGILTNVIRHFQEHANYKKIIVCACEKPTELRLGKINYLGRGFINCGRDLIWSRNDPYCQCCICR